MKCEQMVRRLLDLRMHEFTKAEKFGYETDVDRRLIKDLLWVLDDPRFEEW